MASRLKLLNHPAESPQPRGRHHKNVRLMKTLLLILPAMILASCIHMDTTTTKPIEGILLDKRGHPISGAYIWATYQLPGGLFSAPKHETVGPAITKRNGTFLLPQNSITMIQTGSIFDGRTSPMLVICHRDFGAYGTFYIDERKDLPYQRLEWSDPSSDQESRDAQIADILSEFPAAEQANAWRLIHRK